jgi:hypothetical protein
VFKDGVEQAEDERVSSNSNPHTDRGSDNSNSSGGAGGGGDTRRSHDTDTLPNERALSDEQTEALWSELRTVGSHLKRYMQVRVVGQAKCFQ